MKTLTLMIAVCAAVLLAGCHTVQGFGQDLESLGEKINQKASQ